MPGPGQQVRHPLRVAGAAALALVLMWPAWIAMRNGLADVNARPAIDYLEERRFSDYEVSAETWLAIENSVTIANNLMPGNPQFLAALGWLHQLKLVLFADELSIEEMDVHANAARSYFQQAIASRPTWPYYWGNLALEHYRRGNYATDDYSLALANASRFGPWKNDSQRLVLDLGSETWDLLSQQAKREFILTVERGLHRQPQVTVAIVGEYGAWPEVCEAGEALFDITLPHLRSLCMQKRIIEKDEP